MTSSLRVPVFQRMAEIFGDQNQIRGDQCVPGALVTHDQPKTNRCAGKSYRRIAQIVLVICQVVGWAQVSIGQVQDVERSFFDDVDSDFVEKRSLAAGFAKRISDDLTIKTNQAGFLQETSPGEIELSSHLSADGKEGKDANSTPQSLSAEFSKRLSDVEKQLKKRDDADAKKAGEFPTHKITGFMQVDTAFYSQTPLNIATVGDAQNGTGFRRARFAVQGKVAANTSYQLEMDFATAGRPSFFDNYVEQGNLPFFGEVRAGQYLQPFSVDAMSGFRNLPFLERSLPFIAFVPFRRVGIMSSNATDDDRTHWAYSVFRTGGYNNAPLGDSRYATDFGNVGGYSFSTRVTHLVFFDEFLKEQCFWQIGAGYNFSALGADNSPGSGAPGNPGSPEPFYQARTTPEFGLLGYPELNSNFGSGVNGTPVFVDTGKYQANYFNLFGLETVYQSGAFSFQAEYMANQVESVVGPVFYQGAYGEFMYRLTGESRGYDKKLAALRNPIPFTNFIPVKDEGIRGWGCWEVAARWSVVDLTNPSKLDGHYYNTTTNTFTGTNKAGNGVLNDSTLGLSWFLNAHTKLQINWIHAMLNNTAKGFSTAELFVSRVQVDF